MTTMAPDTAYDTEEKVTTVIADDLHIKGTITFATSLMLKGSLEGEIISEGLLVVGPTAKIDATIVTKSLVSHGSIQGDVTASEEVVLKGTAIHHGNINTPYIVVESGSVFNGSCVMKREKVEAHVGGSGAPEAPTGEAPEGEGAEAQAEGAVILEEEMTVMQDTIVPTEHAYNRSDLEKEEPEEQAAGASEGAQETVPPSEGGYGQWNEAASREQESDQQAEPGEEEAQKSKEESGPGPLLRSSKWLKRELF